MDWLGLCNDDTIIKVVDTIFPFDQGSLERWHDIGDIEGLKGDGEHTGLVGEGCTGYDEIPSVDRNGNIDTSRVSVFHLTCKD